MALLLFPLLVGVVAASPPAARPPSPPAARPGRALTRGERALLSPLFRDAVDYDAIRIVRGRVFPLQGIRTLVTIRATVYVPAALYCDDFASASVQLQAALVHEVAHVWQYANGINVFGGAVRALFATRGRYTRAYDYRLTPGRDLAEYEVEQQATILEHYYLARGPESGRFAGVLRRFLADPHYARRRSPR